MDLLRKMKLKGRDAAKAVHQEASDMVESMRKSPAYAPVGMILGAFAWYALKKLIDNIPCIDAAQLRRTLLALMFAGFYFYYWTQGHNPHDAEVMDNKLVDEVPLLLAGGYYLLHLYPQRYPSTTVQYFISVLAIALVINNEKGASVANTFFFLSEAPNVFLALRGCVAKMESPGLNTFFNIVYPVIFILTKLVALGYHSYLILNNEQVSMILKLLTLILATFSLCYIVEVFYEAFWDGISEAGRRPKSRSRSRSRSRSMSRNRRQSRSRSNRRRR